MRPGVGRRPHHTAIGRDAGRRALFVHRDRDRQSGGGFNAPHRRYAIALDCGLSYAADFVYADGLDIANRTAFNPIGISCRICERPNCAQRAVPPFKAKLIIDHHYRSVLPYKILRSELSRCRSMPNSAVGRRCTCGLHPLRSPPRHVGAVLFGHDQRPFCTTAFRHGRTRIPNDSPPSAFGRLADQAAQGEVPLPAALHQPILVLTRNRLRSMAADLPACSAARLAKALQPTDPGAIADPNPEPPPAGVTP